VQASEPTAATAAPPAGPSRSARPGIEPRGPAAYVAELLGTFALVFFIVTVICVSAGLGFTDYAVIGLVHLLVLMLLINSLGAASGAHFNPAVTVALTAARKINPADAVIYVLVQLAGGTLCALLAKALLTDEGRGVDYGAIVISESFLQRKPLAGLVIEFIATFFLMWAIMAMAVDETTNPDWAGLVIGGTLGLAVLVFAPLTGAGLNPARSFGPALASGEWADFWVYVVGPVLGAVAAALAYGALRLRPDRETGYRPVDKLP